LKHNLLLYDADELGTFIAENPTPAKTQLDANRQAYLEYLYDRDGRHDPAHPMHSLWTGLAVARCRELGQALLDRLARDLMDVEIESLHLDERYAHYFEGVTGHVPVHPPTETGDDVGGDAGEPGLEGQAA
jgi:hypothetical protein